MPPPGSGTHAYALARRFGPAAFVAFALALALYYQALLVAPLHHHSAEAFYALENVWPPSLVQAWRSRVLSLLLAQWLQGLAKVLPELPTSLPAPTLETLGIAQWVALWFLVLSAIHLVAYRERALFYVLGSYACVVFGYSAGLDLRIYPWDMPALAVFALFVALLDARRPPWQIMLAIWAGMPFKETALVLCLFPLALELSWRKRAAWASASLLGCVLLKLGLDLLAGNTALGLTMAADSFYDEGSLFAWNLRQLARGLPLFVNAGTLVAFLLVPSTNARIRTFKWIALAFAACNLLFGVVTEYRIWFEMIPLALYALEGQLRSAGGSR
jgi:hypothetical protein